MTPLQAKTPRQGWSVFRRFDHGTMYAYASLRVLSSLTNAELPDGSGRVGPQWHVSVSRNGKRPSDRDVDRALRAFDMVGAEEDNHEPGVARKFWLPVDPAARVECECKTTEQVIVDEDGYTWTNPTDGPCRGCEHELTVFALTGARRPCPIHSKS